MFADITAACSTTWSQGTVHDVIRKYVFTCSLQMQRYKGSAHVLRSLRKVPRLQPIAAPAAVVQVSSIYKGTYTHYCHSTMSF